MSVATVPVTPRRFAHFPLQAWAFALRNWVAMMLALYVAFWLQLESASSAATCVAILSLQTRGQAFEKAVYRMIGTVVGVVVSIAIAGMFSQTRDMFFLACCTWLGVCAAAASMLDGNRAYGAILSGYTVTIVALPNVDTPLETFSSGINRGAAIVIGILAMAVVSDFFWAPNLFPTVLRKLEAAHRKIKDFAVKSLRQGGAAPEDVAALMKEVTALHPDISALPAESMSGQARAQAARAAATSMLREISAARVVSGSLAAMGAGGDEPRDNLIRALEGRDHEPVRARALNVMASAAASSHHLVAAGACLVLFEQDREAGKALAAMQDGLPIGQRTARLQLYKSTRAAILGGCRAFLALAIVSYIFSLLGWPETSSTLVQLGATVGLSATNPNPRGFAIGAMIAMPLAALTAGVTEFLILDGVDQFELLVLGMGPIIIIASLLLTIPNPLLYGIAFLLLVFFPVLLSPANPQSYNPQSYLFSSFLAIIAVIALFLCLSTILPISDNRRRIWMLATARADLRRALFRGKVGSDPLACNFRDADRIGQFSGLQIDRNRERDLRYLMRMSDLSACARRIGVALATNRQLRTATPRVRAALAALDPERLRALGRAILLDSQTQPQPGRRALRRAAVDCLFAAILIERSPRIVAEMAQDRAA